MTTNRVPGGVAITAPGDTLLSTMQQAATDELGQPARLVNTWPTGADTYVAHFEAGE